jgi:glycosyltransferase involved in cell wall biosynthesis
VDVEGRVKISVAIATFHRAAMVEEAIQAALGQSLVPDEVVVYDDASTDDTAAALSRIASQNPRVRVFRQARNTGGVANWNAAIEATRGDLIAWCSDDDIFERGHLAASVKYLEEHPDVGIVHSGFADYIDTGRGAPQVVRRPLRSPSPLVLDRENLLSYMTRYYDWPFHPSTLVMRRRVWEKVGPFNPEYQLADTDWFVRAAEEFRIVLLPRHGVYNRRHPGNWSNRLGSARMQSEIFQIVEQAILRRWPAACWERALWRTVWRNNVRLRLALVLWQRVHSGHTEAACAAWGGLARNTGRQMPGWLERAGARLIRAWAAGNPAKVPVKADDARQSVSPL